MGYTSSRERMRVGPKGQVVIPHAFRKAMGIGPGSDVLMDMKPEGILIEKEEEKTEEIFQKIASKGKPVSFKPHDAYDEQIGKRFTVIVE